MFSDHFTPESRNSIERLNQNFTGIPLHLLICVFHDVLESDVGGTQVWANDNRGLVDAIDIAKDSCKWSYLWERMLKIIAMALGIPGNLMAAYVSMSIDRITTSVFLTALSLGDFLTIVLRTMTPETTNNAFELLKRSIGFFPNSVLVLICFERYMAVCHPWRKKRMLTLRTAYGAVLSLVLLYILIYSICFAIAYIKMGEGHFTSFAVAIVLFGLPCPFIVVFNWLTIRKLKQMTEQQGQVNAHISYWSKAEASITFMIIIASAVFLALNGPLFIVCFVWFLVEVVWPNHNIVGRAKMEFAVNFAYWLTFLHHGVNFYLYVLGTKRFRMQFIILLKQWRSIKWVSKPFATPSASQAFRAATKTSHSSG